MKNWKYWAVFGVVMVVAVVAGSLITDWLQAKKIEKFLAGNGSGDGTTVPTNDVGANGAKMQTQKVY
jgi:hypothetical protein